VATHVSHFFLSGWLVFVAKKTECRSRNKIIIFEQNGVAFVCTVRFLVCILVCVCVVLCFINARKEPQQSHLKKENKDCVYLVGRKTPEKRISFEKRK